MTLRVVRTADSDWMAPQANGTMRTIHERDAQGVDAWTWTHHHHPEKNRHMLRRRPVHHTRALAVTADPYALWETNV